MEVPEDDNDTEGEDIEDEENDETEDENDAEGEDIEEDEENDEDAEENQMISRVL